MRDVPARYIMIGGFLGAGKTTALAHLGRVMVDRGLRVGLISNDQSTGLVDTALLRSKGFDVEEIAGGCFCCRFDSLVSAANRLSADSSPDVFLAEPVGSCTDLVATVSYPLRRMYGDRFVIAPLSVVVDPQRCARIFGLSEGRSFSSKVAYVYKKQLEEADLIVINKCDAIDDLQRESLVQALKEAYPAARIMCCSAKEGEGMGDWYSYITTVERRETATMTLDYEEYADGEALLGWFNATFGIESKQAFDANDLLVSLTSSIQRRLLTLGMEIAHLKMTLDDGAGNLSVVSVVGSDDAPDLRESLFDRISRGTLVVNLRAEGDPDALQGVVADSLSELDRARFGAETKRIHQEFFRPGKPEPTHRVVLTK